MKGPRAESQRRAEAAVAMNAMRWGALMSKERVTDLNNRGFFYNLGPTYGQQRCAGIDQLLGDAGAAKAARDVQGRGAVPAGNVMREQDKVETEEIRR